MKLLLTLLLFPILIQAQNGVIYKSSLTKDYTIKQQLDSLGGILNTSVNGLSTAVAAKADVSLVNTKTSFQDVSDSVLRKAEGVGLLSDLRITPVMPNKIVMLVGRTAIGDNLGGFYRFDTAATGSDEMTYLNTINSSLTTKGRWVRVFQRARTITGGGIMVNNGGVKNFYISGTTNASGDVVLNLTDDNTATGNALFSEIWSITAISTTDANGPATAVQSYRKSLPAGLKTLTYGFYRANAITITLGGVIPPVASVGAGTIVQFRIDGI